MIPCMHLIVISILRAVVLLRDFTFLMDLRRADDLPVCSAFYYC